MTHGPVVERNGAAGGGADGEARLWENRAKKTIFCIEMNTIACRDW